MTDFLVITQARMTSSRLPGKILRQAGQVSYLEHQMRRLQALNTPVVIATTDLTSDDPVESLAREKNWNFVRGSEQDVLARFVLAARSHESKWVVRITSDCPLIDPLWIQRGMDLATSLTDPGAYVSNVVKRSFPRGMDFEIFSALELFQAEQEAHLESEREHVTPWIRNRAISRGKSHDILSDFGDYSRYRLTLDETADEELLKKLIENHDARHMSCRQVCALLDRYPELAQLNAHVEQKKN